MTDEQIKHMINRFLGWRLPENFNPDAGISFKPEFNVEYMASSQAMNHANEGLWALALAKADAILGREKATHD